MSTTSKIQSFLKNVKVAESDNDPGFLAKNMWSTDAGGAAGTKVPFRSPRTDNELGGPDKGYLTSGVEGIKALGSDAVDALKRGHTGTVATAGAATLLAGVLAYQLLKKKKQAKVAKVAEVALYEKLEEPSFLNKNLFAGTNQNPYKDVKGVGDAVKAYGKGLTEGHVGTLAGTAAAGVGALALYHLLKSKKRQPVE